MTPTDKCQAPDAERIAEIARRLRDGEWTTSKNLYDLRIAAADALEQMQSQRDHFMKAAKGTENLLQEIANLQAALSEAREELKGCRRELDFAVRAKDPNQVWYKAALEYRQRAEKAELALERLADAYRQ